jgi:hypothetical protein
MLFNDMTLANKWLSTYNLKILIIKMSFKIFKITYLVKSSMAFPYTKQPFFDA